MRVARACLLAVPVGLPFFLAAACGGDGDRASPAATQDSGTSDAKGPPLGSAGPSDEAGGVPWSDASDADPLRGFQVEIMGGTRLVVRAPDGRTLLDGLGPAASPTDAAAPPTAGFAIRDTTTNMEMSFGSFKPTESPKGPWRSFSKLAETRSKSGVHIAIVDGNGSLLASVDVAAPDAGHLTLKMTPGPGPERRFSYRYGCTPDDHFAGFGAQTFDVDHRGQTVPTWVQEEGIGKLATDTYDDTLWYMAGRRHSSQVPIPQFLARRGYVFTAETDARALFAMCSEAADAVRVEVEMPLTLHLFDGPSPPEALGRAAATFGRPRMPPRVAFAPWLDAIRGSANVRSVATRLRDERIPVSVIWTEDWRGGSTSLIGSYDLNEEWDVDTSLYPDFKQLAADLHGSGYQFQIYFNPFVFQKAKAWQETEPKGYLIKQKDGTTYTFKGATIFDTASMLDLTNPDARAWALGKIRAAMALGADGWMADFGEWLPTDAVLVGGTGAKLHNRYPVLWQELHREAVDRATDGVTRLFFVRSGWFGTPALADVLWGGDQRTDFEKDDGMPTVMPMGIGLGVVGVSTYTHDIGGYNSVNNPGTTKEVFFRWTELGAFSPVMRTHHGNYPDKNWHWDKDAETIAHFRRYATLHMGLLPYLEGLSKVASTTGLPIWRGLFVAYPDDGLTWPITDEVLVGDGVLVAPVQEAGVTSRGVYLPKGRWFPWNGGPSVLGPTNTTAQAPLEEIPVYARAGAIVPMFPDGVMTVVNGSAKVPDDKQVKDDRIVRAFFGAAGSFTEALGLGYTLEHVGDGLDACTPAFTWDGNAVTPTASSAGTRELHVVGSGVLEASCAGAVKEQLRASGGAADRKLTLLVRY